MTPHVTCHTPGDDLMTKVEPLLKSMDVKHDYLGGTPGRHGDDRQHVREGLMKGTRTKMQCCDHMTFNQSDHIIRVT